MRIAKRTRILSDNSLDKRAPNCLRLDVEDFQSLLTARRQLRGEPPVQPLRFADIAAPRDCMSKART